LERGGCGIGSASGIAEARHSHGGSSDSICTESSAARHLMWLGNLIAEVDPTLATDKAGSRKNLAVGEAFAGLELASEKYPAPRAQADTALIRFANIKPGISGDSAWGRLRPPACVAPKREQSCRKTKRKHKPSVTYVPVHTHRFPSAGRS